jgi:RNA polymerase sigma factor (sigma-70 family)
VALSAVRVRSSPPAAYASPCGSGLRPLQRSEIIAQPDCHETVVPLAGGDVPPTNRSSVSHERLFLDHLDAIERVVATICRRHHATADEAEDFRSLAHHKLIANDYEVLRRFQGRSSMKTYLVTVLQRLFLDWRTAKWGKWRPSAEAKRLGDVAIRLEVLTVRDRVPFETAAEMLRINHNVTLSRDELHAMFCRLPARPDRRPLAEEVLAEVPDPSPTPDALITSAERLDERARASAILARVLRQLEPQDRLLVKLRYFDNLGVADIARTLHLEPKPLYARFDRILGRLREWLAGEGVDARLLEWD